MARYKRRRRKQTFPRFIYWISYTLFALLIALLGYALYTGQTPKMVFDKTRNYLFSAGVAEHHASFSKKELSQLILQKDSIIAKLRNELKLQADTTAYNISYIDVKNDALNMRRSANLASEVIMKIPHRSAVKVVERSERLQVLDGSTGYWIKIEYDGNVGWVWGNYLSNSLPQ